MIPKREILEIAKSNKLRPDIIEKDYVLSWIIAGISEHVIGKSWVFKGGTCLKKCYFRNYRFSEDLDFTVLDPSHINNEFLQKTFDGISEWIYQKTGIEIPSNRISFDIYNNPRDVKSCQGRLFYKGPVSPNAPRQMPRIKLDLSVDEILLKDPVPRTIYHDYSDCSALNHSVNCYDYSELFAEKIRALGQRTRPRDLYDVINLYKCDLYSKDVFIIRNFLREKCKFKSIEMPTLEDITKNKELCKTGWVQQLTHQLNDLQSFESYWNDLAAFFDWLYPTRP